MFHGCLDELKNKIRNKNINLNKHAFS
jgi:hypothetical protein